MSDFAHLEAGLGNHTLLCYNICQDNLITILPDMYANGSNNAWKKKQKTVKVNKIVISKQDNDVKLWKSPLRTLYGFIAECGFRLTQLLFATVRFKKTFLMILLTVLIVTILDMMKGAHTQVLNLTKSYIFWWAWWVWLGFLSSCGFGTGLHTFVLYLGPFIASVTMGAYECQSTKFPEPPFPERVICPTDPNSQEVITLWKIIRKVQMPSIMWGLGTAIGELPPYFMARGARLSGKNEADCEELEEFAEILATDEVSSSKDKSKRSAKKKKLTLTKRAELLLHRLIKRAGFLGILLCASIPNPLFDLAGMTCGHFLVPFWSFFGATFIGKAIFKVHIQQLTVIAISSEHHVDTLVDLIGLIPVYGKSLEEPFLHFLKEQRENIHNKVTEESTSWLKMGIQAIVLSMIVLFVVSIVNAAAQAYYRRLAKWKSGCEIEVTDKTQ